MISEGDVDNKVELNPHEQIYRHILKELNDLIIECDRRWLILDVYGNVGITGYEEKALLGRPLSQVFQEYPLMDDLLEELQTGKLSGRIFQAKIDRKPGPTVYVAASLNRFDDDDGPHFVLTLRDITNKLEGARKTRQMEQSLRKAEKMAYVGSLVQGLAHNLQGSLTTILGRAQLLSMKYPDEMELDDISCSAHAMAENIRSLLIKVKSEQQISQQDLDLNQILKSELKVLEANLFFKHKVKKEYNFDEQLPEIQGIYGDFSQSFTNVIRNALDAMRESQEKRLTITTGHTNTHVVVTVSDTGLGIDEKNLERIFEPYFTTKSMKIGSLEDDCSGMGLGLASVRDLLAPYTVAFELKSKLGKGTDFRFFIPCQKARQVNRKELDECAHAQVQREKK